MGLDENNKSHKNTTYTKEVETDIMAFEKKVNSED